MKNFLIRESKNPDRKKVEGEEEEEERDDDNDDEKNNGCIYEAGNYKMTKRKSELEERKKK